LQKVCEMAKKKSKPDAKAPLRKPRTDGLRNRERILEVAKDAFTRHGAQASLDEIAKQAGVGAGTLYRHFPSREELLKAVYRTEIEKLAQAQRTFAETLPPVDALRAWLLLFVEVIAAKQVIAPALKELVGDPKKVFEASYLQIQQAVRALVKRAIQSGDLRRDIEPTDLLRALIGIALVADTKDWQQSARRLVDILIAGSHATL
jgi:AcrR family transcriptional regulator